MRRDLRIAAVLTPLLLGAACAGTQRADEAARSGFLTAEEYALLRPGGDDEAVLVYRADADLRPYRMIRLDPITVWTEPDSPLAELPEPRRQTLADAFYTLVHAELAKDYAMVDDLGPGVMHVQIALTDAQASNPALDTISTFVPQMLLVSQLVGTARGKPTFVGEASAEARVTDGATGELLGIAVDRRVGGKSFSGSTDSWDDVRLATTYWARQFRYRLCVERGCTPPKA